MHTDSPTPQEFRRPAVCLQGSTPLGTAPCHAPYGSVRQWHKALGLDKCTARNTRLRTTAYRHHHAHGEAVCEGVPHRHESSVGAEYDRCHGRPLDTLRSHDSVYDDLQCARVKIKGQGPHAKELRTRTEKDTMSQAEAEPSSHTSRPTGGQVATTRAMLSVVNSSKGIQNSSQTQPFHPFPSPFLLVLRDTVCSCEAYGMRYKHWKQKQDVPSKLPTRPRTRTHYKHTHARTASSCTNLRPRNANAHYQRLLRSYAKVLLGAWLACVHLQRI